MRSTAWIKAYEDCNVDAGARLWPARPRQIGKGMWVAPDRMAATPTENIAHPMSGAILLPDRGHASCAPL